jgi:hypothetical protein
MLARRIRTDGVVDPCITSRAPKPPSGPDWVHEVKHDGYRPIVRRECPSVRLFTRRGHDWTDRYPATAAAAAMARTGSPCSVRRAPPPAQGRGSDAVRAAAALSDRKGELARLLALAPAGIK